MRQPMNKQLKRYYWSSKSTTRNPNRKQNSEMCLVQLQTRSPLMKKRIWSQRGFSVNRVKRRMMEMIKNLVCLATVVKGKKIPPINPNAQVHSMSKKGPINHKVMLRLLLCEFWAMNKFGKVKIRRMTSLEMVNLATCSMVRCPKITPKARKQFMTQGACIESIWQPVFMANPRAQAVKNYVAHGIVMKAAKRDRMEIIWSLILMSGKQLT